MLPFDRVRLHGKTLLVLAAALTVLLAQAPEVPITHDAARDQLMARDCAELGRCHLVGAATSLRSLHQGAAWTDTLVAARLLGAGMHAQRCLAPLLLALAIALVFSLTACWLRPSAAPLAAGLLLAATRVNSATTVLINPSVALLPDVLCAGALLVFVHTRRRPFLLAAALALAVAQDTHIAAALLWPALVAVALLAGASPWRDALLSLGVALATHILVSPAALTLNLRVLSELGWALPAAGGLAAWMLLARSQRSRFQAVPVAAQTAALGVLLVLPWLLGAAWLTLVQQHPYADTYNHPVAAPVAVAVALAVAGLLERLVASRLHLAAWGLSALVVLAAQPAGDPHALTFVQAERVAAVLGPRAWTWSQVPGHIQAERCEPWRVGLSVAMPAAGPGKNTARSLRILRGGGGTLPRFNAVPGGASLRVGEIDSWLDLPHARACRGRDQQTCQTVGSYRDPPLLAERAFAPVGAALTQQAPTSLVTWEIPWQADAEGERMIQLAEAHEVGGCGWRITGVSGLAILPALPTRALTLRGTAGTAGLLRFERDIGGPACPSFLDRGQPPCWFESHPDEGEARRIAAGDAR